MPLKDETRQKLLEATLELISEKGYLGATTREIASLAGVSEVTLFRKFEKKCMVWWPKVSGLQNLSIILQKRKN